ncbi:MAG: toll/interleukin-1 receptor domain-containing protein [Verrucomicrobiales bacterium]|nr:toll/interleukin-1 receptor domain-containing protein [Verrucomicrobiales bacterium]
MNSIFISYSHQDEAWKDRLMTHLDPLSGETGFEVWEDRRIAAGDDWQGEIEAAMERCRLAVLLVSADFLQSKFIKTREVPALLRRREKDGMRVVPILLGSCVWRRIPWLTPIQIRPKDAVPLASMGAVDSERANAALVAIATEIDDLLKTLPPSQHLAAPALPSPPSASTPPPDDPLPSAPSAFDQRGHPQNSAGKPTPRRKPATKGRTARRPSGPCKDRSEPDNRVARPSVSPDPADAESDLHPSVWQEIRTLFAQDPKLAVDVSSALDHGAGEDRDTWAVLAALVHQEGLVEALRRIRDWLVDQRSVRDPKAWEALVWHLASLGVRDINWLESMRGRLSDARVGKLLELAFEEIEVPGKAWPFAAELYVAAVKDRSTQYIPDASLPPQAWRGVNHVELISPEDLSSPSDLPHVRLRDFVQRILRVNHYPVDDDHERNLETLKDFLHERDPKERFYAIYQEKEPLFDQPLIREMLLLLRYDPKGERRIDRLAGIPEVLRQLLKKLRELEQRV